MDGTPSARVRHSLLRRIITQNEVHSQLEILEHLRKLGVRATQATVSRDLAVLSAQKVHTAGGRSIYVLPQEGSVGGVVLPADTEEAREKLYQITRSLVIEVRRSDNLLVLHSPAGGAQFLASQLDALRLHDVLGTIAGDDTILLIARSQEAASRLERALTEA